MIFYAGFSSSKFCILWAVCSVENESNLVKYSNLLQVQWYLIHQSKYRYKNMPDW